MGQISLSVEKVEIPGNPREDITQVDNSLDYFKKRASETFSYFPFNWRTFHTDDIQLQYS